MVDAVTTNDATARINTGTAMLASNFETFLTLLTTQLKNQDPLSPMDSNQFTAQLTQMTGVEQQLLTNDLLTSLLAAQQGGGLTSARQLHRQGRHRCLVRHQAGRRQGDLGYELGADASQRRRSRSSTAAARSSGRAAAPKLTTGTHDFIWDGKTTAGGQLPDGGVYTLKITATNGAGDGSDARS